jgi:hypothetical protein
MSDILLFTPPPSPLPEFGEGEQIQEDLRGGKASMEKCRDVKLRKEGEQKQGVQLNAPTKISPSHEMERR